MLLANNAIGGALRNFLCSRCNFTRAGERTVAAAFAGRGGSGGDGGGTGVGEEAGAGAGAPTNTALVVLNDLQVHGTEAFDISKRHAAAAGAAYGDCLGYHEAAFIGDRLRSDKYGAAVAGLRLLDVRTNGVDAEAAAHICSGLAVNVGVTRASLEHNPLGDGGARHLRRTLAVNATLRRLSCYAAGITRAGEADLAAPFRRKENTTLVELNDIVLIGREVLDLDDRHAKSSGGAVQVEHCLNPGFHT